MSSETSTEPRRRETDAGLHPRHLFLLLSMLAATAAVIVVGKGHPVALVLLSLTVVAAGLVGLAFQGALAGFFGISGDEAEPERSPRLTEALEREKALVLRSIKELEFDRKMGKMSDGDFAQLSAALRARALALMQELDRAGGTAAPQPPAPSAAAATTRTCASCGTEGDPDARFCKNCGGKL